MKKVYQTILHDEEKGINGNCVQASIASLLEIKIEDAPNVFDFNEDTWGIDIVNWFCDNGYEYEATLYNSTNGNPCTLTQIKDCDGVKGFFIAGVYSPSLVKNKNGFPLEHAVIINKNLEIVHDPHPKYQDVRSYPKSVELGHNGILDIWVIKPIEAGK